MSHEKPPGAFLNQRNQPFDPTSFWEPPKDIRCYHCNEWMRGDQGISRARKLAGSEVYLQVIVHPGCQENER